MKVIKTSVHLLFHPFEVSLSRAPLMKVIKTGFVFAFAETVFLFE